MQLDPAALILLFFVSVMVHTLMNILKHTVLGVHCVSSVGGVGSVRGVGGVGGVRDVIGGGATGWTLKAHVTSWLHNTCGEEMT